jgi:pimeloyl-ACP methyl ester carboxylesterase
MSLREARCSRKIDALPRAQLTRLQLAGSTQLGYFAYRPSYQRADQPPLVFVHGYSRRAREHAQALLPLCETLGCTLLAPLFAKAEHPRYQRLGRGIDGQRADRVLNACLEDLFGSHGDPINLAGFSGGAQFAHRYTMAHPERVAHLVAIAAGWYTLPDPSLRYPLGLHSRRVLRGISLNPEQFLRVPTTVIVGDQDTGELNLRHSVELDAQQGITRVERARNWVAYMRMAAKIHRQESLVRYLEVPGIGHDFGEFIALGRLLELMRDSLTTKTRPPVNATPFLPIPDAEIRATARGASLDCA